MKDKNYWPHAIIGILLFGVFMVSTSITIALKNPIQDENTYFGKKRDIDERINEIIKAQQEFSAIFTPSFFAQGINPPKPLHPLSFSFPYESIPQKSNAKELPSFQNSSYLFLKLAPKGERKAQIESIKLFLDSTYEANALQELGELKSVQIGIKPPVPNQTQQASNLEQIYRSQPLEALPLGRRKLIVEISYFNEFSESSPKAQKAYFETIVNIK